MILTQFPMADMVVRQGDNLMLTCTVLYPDGADNELMVYWTINGQNNLGSLSTTNSTERTVTSILQLQDIQPQQADAYFCLYQFDGVHPYFGDRFRLTVYCESGLHVNYKKKCMHCLLVTKMVPLNFLLTKLC